MNIAGTIWETLQKWVAAIWDVISHSETSRSHSGSRGLQHPTQLHKPQPSTSSTPVEEASCSAGLLCHQINSAALCLAAWICHSLWWVARMKCSMQRVRLISPSLCREDKRPAMGALRTSHGQVTLLSYSTANSFSPLRDSLTRSCHSFSHSFLVPQDFFKQVSKTPHGYSVTPVKWWMWPNRSSPGFPGTTHSTTSAASPTPFWGQCGGTTRQGGKKRWNLIK